MSVASAERKTKKKGGGLTGLLRKEQKEPITEEELMRKDIITPEDVLRLNKVTDSKSRAFLKNFTSRVVFITLANYQYLFSLLFCNCPSINGHKVKGRFDVINCMVHIPSQSREVFFTLFLSNVGQISFLTHNGTHGCYAQVFNSPYTSRFYTKKL